MALEPVIILQCYFSITIGYIIEESASEGIAVIE
jgi:hypothetical protein